MFELSFFKKASRRKLIFSSQHQKRSCHKRFFSATKERGNFELPELHILEEIASSLSSKQNNMLDMSTTGLIGVQHMLPSTASLFNAISKYLKIPKENMFFSGKFYSSCPEVEDYIRKSGIQLMPTKAPKKHSMYEEYIEEKMADMWDKFIFHLENNPNIDKILILDEGGHCLKMMPKHLQYDYKISAIEQTRFGLYDMDGGSQLFPLIDVARSAAKRKLESPLIAAAITLRVSDIIKNLKIHKKSVCGVIGNGAVGSAVAKYLLSQGYKVIVYDESDSSFHGIHNSAFYRVTSVKKVILTSDIVFGCTGRDISKDNDIVSCVKSSITLVNCTSQNIEFLEMLKKATSDKYLVKTIGDNMSQLQYVEGSKEINILEDGFPINFDRTPKSDPVEDMELTRCLLYCAVAQASFLAKKPIGDGITPNDSYIQMLDPNLQKLIVEKWIENQPKNRYSTEEIKCFNDIKWIEGNSGGENKENNFFASCFNPNNTETQNRM